MPELPEVETTRRGLEPLIVGRKIVATRIHQKATTLGDTLSPTKKPLMAIKLTVLQGEQNIS